MQMTIDITPKAVEHLCAIHEGYEQHGTVATLHTLSAALKDKQDDTYLRGFNAGQLSLKNAGEFTVIDSPELADLRAALTAAQAETAAAYEVAAGKADTYIAMGWWGGELPDAIRALTPGDSKAALDRMLADARADGMREAAAIVARHGETGRKALANALDREEANDWGLIVMRCDLIRDAILASIPKGTSHE
jgi:predicted PhzF superfamily epimerase YddE/YHI9